MMYGRIQMIGSAGQYNSGEVLFLYLMEDRQRLFLQVLTIRLLFFTCSLDGVSDF